VIKSFDARACLLPGSRDTFVRLAGGHQFLAQLSRVPGCPEISGRQVQLMPDGDQQTGDGGFAFGRVSLAFGIEVEATIYT
tara:strand:+ start:1139 stop:1381 length:243 start_codon:yes stop_codon:yes gene_type:complete